MAKKTPKQIVEMEDKHRKMMFSNPEEASKICTEILAWRKENPDWKEQTRAIREGE